jgi:hypothetical protein
MCGALSDESMDLQFTRTFASGPCQRSYSRDQVPQNSRPYITFSFDTPQPGGPGSRIYIPQEQGVLVTPPGSGFPFRRLLLLAEQGWRYSNPYPHGSHTTEAEVVLAVRVRVYSQVQVILRPTVSRPAPLTSLSDLNFPCLTISFFLLCPLSDERTGL